MTLSASTLGSLIAANLSSAGAVGSNKVIFANAVGLGIVTHIVGKSFSTADTGDGAGGTGTGTGITGLSSSTMKSTALTTMSSQGVKADPLMNAIMNAVVTHLANATLTTTNPSVGTGSGTITVGSIAVTSSGMATEIQSALAASGANGANMPNLALAIATGVASNILSSGTGSVTISGSGPPPAGTSGTGTGTIS